MNLPEEHNGGGEALPLVRFYNKEQSLEVESLKIEFSEKFCGEEYSEPVFQRLGASKWRIRITSSKRRSITLDLEFEYVSPAYPKKGGEGMPKYSLVSDSKHVDIPAIAQQLEEMASWYVRPILSLWATTLQEIVDDAEKRARAARKKRRNVRQKDEEKPGYLDDFFATLPKDPRPFIIYSIGKDKGKSGWYAERFPVINVRCINNKNPNIDYRRGRGYDDDIQQNVMKWSDAKVPNHNFMALFKNTVDRIQKEGHKGVAFQCSRGKHRSVAMACILQKRVFVNAIVQHVMLSKAPRPKFQAAVRKAKEAGWRPE